MAVADAHQRLDRERNALGEHQVFDDGGGGPQRIFASEVHGPALGIDSGDIPVLTQPRCYVATYLHLPATTGTVSVFPTDAVVVQARVQARARISQ